MIQAGRIACKKTRNGRAKRHYFGEILFIEQRVVKATDYLDWFEPAERKRWLGLSSLVEITSTRWLKGQTSTEKRYYLTSHAPDAEQLGRMVRCHWGLDMTFAEDHCRLRKGHAAENLALLRKPTLNLLCQNRHIRR